MWSLCNGTYRVYHYDYRGSVVAVTDINGTVTDTIRYNAYGSVYARTGSANLIFGYNGRDGVLTDPNGLLYMRARYYDPLLKRFMNCDILTGSIANPSTLNLYAYVNGDPISYVDPFGMSAERINNNKVIDNLRDLYNFTYDYYYYPDEMMRMKIANQAVLIHLINDVYYEAGFKQELAWSYVSGAIDAEYLTDVSNRSDYSFLVNTKFFYDPDSGDKIDFIHMLATISAYNNEDNSIIPAAYAGWAGDLISLAGDIQEKYNAGKIDDINKRVKELLSSGSGSRFALDDFLADIDAVSICEYMQSMPIYEAFEKYYSSAYKKRFEHFRDIEFGANISKVNGDARYYLSPTATNKLFRSVFSSTYNQDLIPYIADAFTEYIIYEVGR